MMDEMQMNHLKGAAEALLFVSEKPVTVDQLKDAITGAQTADLKDALKALAADYQTAGKGIVIIEVAGGWQMLSASVYAVYIREFYKTRHKEKLSRPALETLAIIAYKQPVSRTDVELIRGVNSDGVVMHLLNKGLIKIAGRKEVPGRPYVYGTTGQFLEYFGLRSLEDLPKLEEFPALMANANEARATVNLEPRGTPGVQEALAGNIDGKDAPAPAGVTDAEVEEELARARTKLDIDQLEKETQTMGDGPALENLGESSGQSRVMNDNGENGHGPDTAA